MKRGLAIAAAIIAVGIIAGAAALLHWFGGFADDLYPFDNPESEQDQEAQDGED